jgi:hypothetical protein
MKKREVVLGILILCFGILLPLIFAQDEIGQTTDNSEEAKVNKAYACLAGKIGNCSSLGTEEKIFALLSTGLCKDEVIAKAMNKTGTSKIEQQCWGVSNSCDLEMTAQAVLALEQAGEDTTYAKNWILQKETSPPDIDWFLQIDSITDLTGTETMTCHINKTIATGTGLAPLASLTINADKKIELLSPSSVKCFSKNDGDYWLKIASSCYDEEFSIYCDKNFLTTLFFTETESTTYHVLSEVHSGTADNSVLEKINSFCFGTSSSCDAKGSLWSALALHIIDEDTSAYMPYLVTMADVSTNGKDLPWAFLYALTSEPEYFATLFSKQIAGKSWNNKIYDTALALYPLKNEEFETKQKAKDWILLKQNSDGCLGSIKDTAFVLHSVWPGLYSGTGGTGEDGIGDDGIGIITEEVSCEDSGFFCMNSIDCTGNVLESYSCANIISKCCDIAKPLESCIAQQGEICNSEQNCIGGTTVDASLLSYGETCCIGGVCEIPSEAPAVSGCESVGGLCRATGCEATEEESTEVCDFGDTCCVEKSVPVEGKSYWWIWVLLLLIVFVVLGIIFREKLRPLYLRIKEKFNSIFKKKTPGYPGQFGMRPNFPPRTMPPPRFGPPTGRPGARPPQQGGEINDVLRKLKEMGK